MDDGIWLKIKSNIARELGDASGDLENDISSYVDTVVTELAAYPYWSWYPAAATLITIRSAIPNHYSSMIEFGVLAKLDALEVRAGWSAQYEAALAVKKKDDALSIGKYASGTNAILTAVRDLVYKDLAVYHEWSWLEHVPLTISTDSGQEYITIPSYLGKEIKIYQELSGKEIDYISPDEFGRLRGATTTGTAKPTHYTVIYNRIYFHQPATAGTSFSVIAYINAALIADNSTPAISGIKTVIPGFFDSTIEWGILRKIDPSGVFINCEMLYYTEMEKLKSHDRRSKSRNIKSVQDKAALNSRSYMR